MNAEVYGDTEDAMTPQERKMIDELFDRLASIENAPRDADAVNAINAGLDRAPNALYPLVQSVLVQDEALKRADARIRELEDELGITPEQPQQKKSFLEGMRDSVAGRREQQGSVPSVRLGEAAPGASAGSKWGSGTTLSGSGYSAPQGGSSAAAQEAGSSGGGSFLGTAAATAAGVVGGALLMNSMRGMFGGGQQGQGNRAFDQGGAGSPLAPGGSGGGDLARQAGADDIGRGGNRAAAYDSGEAQRQGAFDVAQNDAQGADHSDFADDDGDFGGDFDSGGDSDTA
jgi:uncharacterized protein